MKLSIKRRDFSVSSCAASKLPTLPLLALALGLHLAAGTARAELVSYTSSGIIEYGRDDLGLFGPTGADLRGKSFQQTIIVNTSQFNQVAQDDALQHTLNAISAKGVIRGRTSVGGQTYVWEVPDKISATINLRKSVPESSYQQLFLGLAGNENLTREGIAISPVHDFEARENPFLQSLQFGQSIQTGVWQAGRDGYASFWGYKDSQTSLFQGKPDLIQYNIAHPQAGQIDYIAAHNPLSGDLVRVGWSKWWGAHAQRWELLHNGNQVCGGQLPSQTETQQAQSGNCDAYLHSGENRFVLRLCEGAQCTDSAPYVLAAVSPNPDWQAGQWRADSVYQQGQQVNYQNRIYQARYWTQGNVPAESQAWQLLGNTTTRALALRVADWKNDAQAAYSIVFDDYCAWANDAGLLLGEAELQARQLVASFGVIAGACGDPAWSSHWPNLQAFLQRGHEVFNHSYDHGHPQNAPWANKPWAGNDLEIRASTALIAQHLHGYQASFFGFPFDVANQDQLDYLRVRGQYLGTRTPNYWQANGVNEKNFADPFRLRFQVYAQADQGEGNPASLSNLLAQTVSSGGYGMRVFHSVADNYYESIPLDNYRAHLDQVQNLVRDGQLWVATISDVLRYRFAREHCRLLPPQTVAHGLLLSFANRSETCQRYAGKLSLSIDNGNPALRAWQGGRELPLRPGRHNGQWLLDADPHAGAILLQ